MLETLDKYRRLVLPYIIMLGALIYFYYCMSIGFYPSEISIADTLFFLWIILIFGLFYLVILHAFFCVSVLSSSLLGKMLNRHIEKNKSRNTVPFPVMTKGEFFSQILQFTWVFCFLFLWFHKVGPTTSNLIGFGGVIFITSLGYSFFCKIRKDESYVKSELYRKLCLISIPVGIAILPVFLIDGALRTTTYLTFEKVGVRQNNVDIKLQPESVSALEKHSGAASEIVLNNEWLMEVDILFKGVGDTTKLRLNDNFDVVIPNEQIQLIVNKR